MAKSKYKKVTPVTNDPAADRKHAPLVITINSDGNVIEFVSYQGGIYTYRYTLSNTKMNQTITFTQEHFDKFLHRNSQVNPQPFLPWKPPGTGLVPEMQQGCKKKVRKK